MRYSIRFFRGVVAISAIVLFAGLFSGCSETPTAGPAASANGENGEDGNNDPGPVPEGQHEPEPANENEQIELPIPDQSSRSANPDLSPTHVITQQVVYYKAGPQQAIPPDGKLEAGTKVCIVREAGSYTEIKAENGVQGYVTADSLKRLESK